ncbi:MAG TPA: O-antigen ligase family protein [Terriglobales bacterium]|nr:O-antigen ligase family protein [Terriglobales bacterium]
MIDIPASESAAILVDERTTRRLESLAFVGMIFVLMLAPLLFGATEVWSQFIQRTCIALLLALWTWQQYLQREVLLVRNPVYVPALCFGLIGILQFLFGWTVYRHATNTELLNLAAYGGLILIAAETMDRRRRQISFVSAMGCFGSALAVFSILQKFSETKAIYGFREVHAISAYFFGPYANHNHYAGLMEMLAPLAMAAGALERGAKRYLLWFGASLMTFSIYLCGSRGGIIAAGAGIVFACAMRYRQLPGRQTTIQIAMVILCLFALTAFLGTEKNWRRASDLKDGQRMTIAGDTLRMSLHNPLLGFGLGTFQRAYPKYQSFSDEKLINHAHNDYLETLADTGILGLGIFGFLIVTVYRAGLSKMRERVDEEGQILTLAALSGITALLVHSFFDFNLHIPANAALFFVLCSMVATPFRRRIQPEPVELMEEELIGEGERF